MRILVTGAAGFLGTEIVRMATERGHGIRSLIRSASQRPLLQLGITQKPDFEVFISDLGQVEDLSGAVEGIDGIIHCAAVTSEGTPDEELSRRVNIEGTRHLLEAAQAAGVRRWVQISSMSAHPASTSVYGRTKLGADEVLRDSPSGQPEWVLLRPSLIYGPGGKGLVAKTVGLMKRLPVLPIVGSGREPIRPVYVADVASAALRCLEVEGVGGRTYQIGGADEVTLNDFMARLARSRGLRRPLVHLPIWISLTLAKLLAVCLKTPPLTVDNVLGVRQALRVDISGAQHDWGYDPLGLDEGLRRTFDGQCP
jgi:nucleoside-diphosphate-sugar epimerase